VGTVIIKCMLHISPAEQKERLLARLDDPTKYWKYNPGDVDERQRWAEYTKAYEIALERTNTDVAPWFIVPSDKKWYRNYAIGELLEDELESMGLDWPQADFDIAAERARLAADTIGEQDA
jgi:polyphosphate kinase 2 (PPK2 family)